MFERFPENGREDFGEWSRRFRGMFEKFPENGREDSGGCSRRFWGMLLKILGNVPEDSGESKFRFISCNLSCFLSNFAVKLPQNNRKK